LNKRPKSILLSQEGKAEPALITALLVALIGFIIAKFSGTKVFIFKLSSGIIRLVIGLFSALFCYVWWGMDMHEIFSLGELGEQVVVYSLLVCSVLAFVLIPVGTIQIIGSLIKPKQEEQIIDKKEKERSKRNVYILIQLVGLILLFYNFFVGLAIAILGSVLLREETKKNKAKENNQNNNKLPE
jgi:hypothetical protein